MKTTQTTQTPAHTPGPWMAQKHDSLPVYEINNGPGYERTQVALNVSEANARLIAAAPCLLAALKALHEVGLGSNADIDGDDDAVAAMKLAGAALAKAESTP